MVPAPTVRSEAVEGHAQQAYECLQHSNLDQARLESLWRKLPGGAAFTPFQSVEFLDCFRRNMLATVKGEFHVYEFRRAGTSTPLMYLPVLIRQRGPVRIASLPDLTLADQSAPVLARAYDIPAEHASELWRSFTGNLSGADLFDFHNIVPGVDGQPNPFYHLPEAVDDDSQYMLDLRQEGGIPPWRRKSLAKELRTKFRKLQLQGVEFAVVVTKSERATLWETMLAQKQQRFEVLGRTNLLAECSVSSFYRSLAAADNASRVCLFSLRRDEEIVAACLAFLSGRSLSTVILSIGADHWHSCSPGVVLMSRVLDWAEANGIDYFGFGTGRQLYKQRFGGEEVTTRRLSGSLTRAGDAYRFVRAMKNVASRSA